LLLLSISLLTLACECSKQECMEEHGLIEPGSAPQANVAPPPGPNPGPIIILIPGTGNNGWKVGSGFPGTGGSANGVLREDFIGQSILTIDIKYTLNNNTGVIPNADKVTLTKTGTTVVLERSSQNTAIWRANGTVLTPVPLLQNEVPSELADLSFSSSVPPLPAGAVFQELKIQVKMKP
jgi:hypothetical protein